MKFIKVALIVFFVVSIFTVNAQSKIGHINSAELIKVLPSYMKAEKEIEKQKTFLDAQLMELVKEYRAKVEKYNALPDTTMPIIKQNLATEIQQLQERSAQFQETAEKTLVEKQEELLTPILAQIQTAIDEVAKEKGYDYIFNVESKEVMLLYRSALYTNEKNDITLAVKKKLEVE